jgi:hypothetical protein
MAAQPVGHNQKVVQKVDSCTYESVNIYVENKTFDIIVRTIVK